MSTAIQIINESWMLEQALKINFKVENGKLINTRGQSVIYPSRMWFAHADNKLKTALFLE